MKRNMKFVAALLMGVLVFALMTACTGDNDTTPAATTTAPAPTTTAAGATPETTTAAAAVSAYEPGSVAYFMSREPMPLTIWAGSEPHRIEQANLDCPFRAEVYQLIADMTNTIPTFEWIAMADQGERAILAMAAGTTPALSVVGRDLATFNAGQNGHLWDIAPVIGNFENLSHIHPIVIANASQNGHLYGVPRLRDLARSGWYMNQDWLDNLGLNVPNTVDELWDVLHAFTFNDPNGTGTHNTMGMFINPAAMPNHIIAWHGGGFGWVEQNGELVPVQLTAEYEAAIEFIRRGFTEGIFEPVPEGMSLHDAFVAEMSGFVVELIDSAARSQDRMHDAGLQTEVAIGNGFAPAAGQNISFQASEGFNGLVALGVRELPTEAHRDHALFFLDRMSEPELLDVFNWGLEGVTFYVGADGYAVRRVGADREADGQCTLDFMGGFNQFISFQEHPDKVYLRGPAATPLRALQTQTMQQNVQFAMGNPAAGYISATQSELNAELNLIINEARSAFVLGEIDHATWQGEIQRWLNAGMNTVIEEINAVHAEISARQ